MAKGNLETASVLAFERKLQNSDGLMFAGNWRDMGNTNAWVPVRIQDKEVRGTISNRLKNELQKDPAKLDAEIQKANLQRVDVAALPSGSDTLRVSFSLRALGDLTRPSACNNAEYQSALASVIQTYAEKEGFRELAGRYATNLANGRFLWRNRLVAEKVMTHIKHVSELQVKREWKFDSFELSTLKFDTPSEELSEVAEVIRKGLSGTSSTYLEIDSYALLGKGQEVFPSQEMMLDKSDAAKSKTLYQVDGIAAMHSQKIGNALRTIDTWFPEANVVGPIAAEPFGSVTNRGRAYRSPKEKVDFYSLLDNWVLKGIIPDQDQQHYVIATLIRGGVFGAKAE